MSTRVLVVDDASLFRRIISDALAGVPGVEVVGTAANGKLALARMAALRPDVITLDIEMPEMSGLEVLKAMRREAGNTSAIMLSSQTTRGGEMTVRALEAGAFDFITKPEGATREENLRHLRESLRPMIRALERKREIRCILHPGAAPLHVPAASTPRTATNLTKLTWPPLVLIGASTGGPTALAQLLPTLPANLGVPVFVVQHMPPLFTGALAERLQSLCALQVKEAQNGEIARAGWVYVAPGGRHMRVAPGPSGEILIRITDDPPENSCRPSVDYLFRSAAAHFPGRSVAAVLTGMGSDGTVGLRLLKRGGCLSIAQDEATCVVYGMPREAVAAGVVDMVLPLGKIAEAIARAVNEVRRD